MLVGLSLNLWPSGELQWMEEKKIDLLMLPGGIVFVFVFFGDDARRHSSVSRCETLRLGYIQQHRTEHRGAREWHSYLAQSA